MLAVDFIFKLIVDGSDAHAADTWRGTKNGARSAGAENSGSPGVVDARPD